jgi:hypothetical protein
VKKKKVPVKKKPQPEVSSPAAPVTTDLEEFKKSHGADYARLIQHPAFRAATLLLNIRKLDSLTNLTNEDIAEHGREILADLRGHLKHENNGNGFGEIPTRTRKTRTVENLWQPK